MATPPEPEPPADPMATAEALANFAALCLVGAIGEMLKAGLATVSPEDLAALDQPGNEPAKAEFSEFIARGKALTAEARSIVAAVRDLQAARPAPPDLTPSAN